MSSFKDSAETEKGRKSKVSPLGIPSKKPWDCPPIVYQLQNEQICSCPAR
jgi:hypothetical protein